MPIDRRLRPFGQLSERWHPLIPCIDPAGRNEGRARTSKGNLYCWAMILVFLSRMQSARLDGELECEQEEQLPSWRGIGVLLYLGAPPTAYTT